ncbi:hypothetical protein B484DRAFT_431813 [Ochromonadaceae sp. CCMP2298]|nr:hypothetical protein B484DRAFT_431813 [Ochromonadaceae sp. CCMP2298]
MSSGSTDGRCVSRDAHMRETPSGSSVNNGQSVAPGLAASPAPREAASTASIVTAPPPQPAPVQLGGSASMASTVTAPPPQPAPVQLGGSASTASTVTAPAVEVCVDDQGGDRQHFRVRTDAPLEKLIRMYHDRKGVVSGIYRFRYEGVAVNRLSTPESFGYPEDGEGADDIIALVECTGGTRTAAY